MKPQEIMKNLDAKITGSEYFTWGEALWMSQSNAYALPTEVQVANIVRLAAAMDKVREHFKTPILVHSWLRTPAHNKLIGGALKSAHLEGLAIDFTVSGQDVHKCREILVNDKVLWPYRGELGVQWIHLDLKDGRWFWP